MTWEIGGYWTSGGYVAWAKCVETGFYLQATSHIAEHSHGMLRKMMDEYEKEQDDGRKNAELSGTGPE